MGKSSDPPPAPDFAAAAKQQGDSALQNTTSQTWANRPTLNTPWGSMSWNQGSQTDPSTGQPVTSWEGNVKLSPEQQQALDSQMAVQTGRSGAAQDMLGRAVQGFQPNLDYSGMPGAADHVGGQQFQTSLNGSSGDYRQRAQDAITQLQQPDLNRRRAAMDTQLANQGITRGSEAYDAAQREQGDAETRAHLAAIGEGRNEASMAFGQDLQAGQFGNQGRSQQVQSDINAGGFNNQNRQQAIAEFLMKRNQPLNELNAMLTGQQVGMPQMPNFNTATKTDTTQYLPAAQAQYGAGMDAYNAQQAGNASTMSGLFGLGSAAIGAPGGWGGLFKF